VTGGVERGNRKWTEANCVKWQQSDDETTYTLHPHLLTMSCSNEAHGHDHGDHDHGHGHGHEGHDHDDPVGTGPHDSLYSQIDVVHVTALNAVGGPEAGQKVIK
jgi:hypothetical protein